jgi:hypothetical protein
MMAIANWNNDIGDYWEWSAEGLYGDAPTAIASAWTISCTR